MGKIEIKREREPKKPQIRNILFCLHNASFERTEVRMDDVGHWEKCPKTDTNKILKQSDILFGKVTSHPCAYRNE